MPKYFDLPPEEMAYRIVYFDHMLIDQEYFGSIRISPTKIMIPSVNPCPYLEACKQLGLDTKVICKEVGEPSLKEIIKLINPRLEFSRNYDKIRPYSNYCEEFIEFK